MALDLRPLTLAELLDRSFSTYKRHLWLFVGIMAVPAVAATLYAVAMQAVGGTMRPDMTPEQVMFVVFPMVIGVFVFVIVLMVVHTFALGATAIAVGQLYNGLEPTVGGSYREARRHGGRLILLLIWASLRLGGTWMGLVILTAVLAGLLTLASRIAGGILVFVGLIGGFLFTGYLAIRYGVSVPAVVLEDLPAGQALKRSVFLTEGHRGRVFLIMLCAAMINYATAALLQGPFMIGAMIAGPGTPTAIALSIAGAVLGGIGSMFSGPIMIIGLAMIYYDLRIRKEALDLRMMLDSLDTPR
jgi:Membrane domain of glycerophosphoryl diester phosphodiesterase